MGPSIQLGQVSDPPHQQVQPSPQQFRRMFESLSLQRRCARHEAARAENTKNTEAVEAVEIENQNENIPTGGVDEIISDNKQHLPVEMINKIIDCCSLLLYYIRCNFLTNLLSSLCTPPCRNFV